MTPRGLDHSACDFAWKQVKCDRCGRKYRCTPSDDHYCAAEGDHCCEPCLLGVRLQPIPSADHPHQDPGDGRKECDRCGKFVWPVTHSCKGVPVTRAAWDRYAARLDGPKRGAEGDPSKDLQTAAEEK